MRELTGHKVNDCNGELKVEVLDAPGGVQFQKGPIKEVGTNGVTHEALLAILIDRLEGFQSGPYAHGYNADALRSLKSAQSSLQQRTRDRLHRGVEGTHTV